MPYNVFLNMRVPRNGMTSEIALYYANLNCRGHLFGFGALADKVLRKEFCSKREIFAGIPVYFIESREDLSFASSMLENAANLLKSKAPFWEQQIKNIYGCIMILGMGRMFFSDRIGRSGGATFFL